jgi:hypothetical protein
MRGEKWKIGLMALLILTATLITTVNIQPAQSSESSLVGYWKFDEGTGTIAHDSSGNNNHGTINGGPIWVDGISGLALHFDGDDDNVMVPDSNSLHITDPLTIDFWFKPDVEIYAGFEEAYILVGKWHGIGDQWRTGFLVNLNVNTHPGDGKMRFWLGFGNGEMEILASTRDVWHAGEWYHITATYDRSLPSGNAKLYINGTLDSQLDAHKAIAPNTLSLYINLDPYELWHPYNTYFPGIIDEVKIYGAHAELPPPPPPGVGGIVIPVDKFALLAPYIGLTSTIVVAAVVSVVYIKRVKRGKEKQ